ncbi:MAG: carboxypeptidase regulatory-like domain-containing protein, partial [Spirochaetota bacterium]|nr:carboxypeptidase regulatory-like domain-containing protein [Spirochaetota bacterium]HPV98147.1 carboxypeptidase regulatory-like domain-containing protein [Spirochaetota bacterium]
MFRTIRRTAPACARCIIASLLIMAPAAAQALTLRGTVYDDTKRRPVDFGTVIVLEARAKARTAENGSYAVQIPEPGEYTVIVQSEGLRQSKTRIRIDRDTVRDFHLGAISIRGAALTITGERDIQKVSRYTMTVRELKEVPASFGDSISALTALPGVIRTDGFFGPLVIRGGLDRNNNYFIDDIPIYSPMHFGGLHSVINNNLMSEIDLFSSAFPAQYGSANAAVISINTVDGVKEFGGYADIGLISASALVQTPILKTKDGKPYFPSPTGYIEKEEAENAG